VSTETVNRAEAIRRARRVLDDICERIARDRAAGRLTPEVAAYLDRVAPLPQQQRAA
jgi:hypothetical protein